MGGVQGHGEGGFPGHQPGARRGEMRPHDTVKSPTWKSLGQAPESTKFAKDEDTDCPFSHTELHSRGGDLKGRTNGGGR